MKKFFLILICIFTVIGIFSAANAGIAPHRELKCVPLVDGTQTTCTSSLLAYNFHIDWAAECTTNRVIPVGNIYLAQPIISEVKGVGLCSNQEPESCANGNCDWTYADPTMIQETITTSDRVEENRFCWCKMTTPAVSLWVFGSVLGDAGACARDCAKHCAIYVQRTDTTGAAFRSALFSNMTD